MNPRLCHSRKVIKYTIWLILAILLPVSVSAVVMESDNYQIKSGEFTAASGNINSANYQLENNLAWEQMASNVNSANYKSYWGFLNTFWEPTISFSLDSNSLAFGTLTVENSATGSRTITVSTNAPSGYLLLVSQDKNLTHTDTATTISNHNGTIDTPVLWGAPNNYGLGFTLTSATELEAKYGSNPDYKYAGFPTTPTAFHSVSAKATDDATTIGYKINVPSSQKSGSYNNTLTYTVAGRF